MDGYLGSRSVIAVFRDLLRRISKTEVRWNRHIWSSPKRSEEAVAKLGVEIENPIRERAPHVTTTFCFQHWCSVNRMHLHDVTRKVESGSVVMKTAGINKHCRFHLSHYFQWGRFYSITDLRPFEEDGMRMMLRRM